MKRLQEHQLVWLCAAHRDGPARQCTVVTVYRDIAVLAPLTEQLSDRNGAPTDWYLVFEHEDRPIALRGTLDYGGDEDLRFKVTDGALVRQTAAPRVARELPIELVATDRPYAEPVQGMTAAYSADGALLKDAGDLVPGEAVQFTFTPREDLKVSGRGTVLAVEDRFGIAFSGIDHVLRERMVEDVISAKRKALAAK